MTAGHKLTAKNISTRLTRPPWYQPKRETQTGNRASGEQQTDKGHADSQTHLQVTCLVLIFLTEFHLLRPIQSCHFGVPFKQFRLRTAITARKFLGARSTLLEYFLNYVTLLLQCISDRNIVFSSNGKCTFEVLEFNFIFLLCCILRLGHKNWGKGYTLSPLSNTCFFT